MGFLLTQHAEQELIRRGIPRHLLEEVLDAPQQIIVEYHGRKAYQSICDFGGGKTYLLRVIVDDRVDPPMVVTLYRTSKVDKYWRQT